MGKYNSLMYVPCMVNIMKNNPSNGKKMISLLKQEDDSFINWMAESNLLNNNITVSFFPKSLRDMLNKNINYYSNVSYSINNLLKLSSIVTKLYKNQVNLYVTLKNRYEMELLSGFYDKALITLGKIEEKICVSVWSMYQKLLIYNLLENIQEVNKIIDNIKKYCTNGKFVPFMLLYYEKLSNKSIGFNEYLQFANELIESYKSKSIISKYISHKFNIIESSSLQGIKISLIIDEQISFIDYYESYVNALQLLNRKSTSEIVKDCINSEYNDSRDYRIRNLYISEVGVIRNYDINYNLCTFIENYTQGNRTYLQNNIYMFLNEFNCDFTIYNLMIKAGIDISEENINLKELWKEIYNIYTFNYECTNSIEKIGQYYKLFFGTSWRYKLLGLLIRKLKIKYDDDIIKLSTLNDYNLTPLFSQIISNNDEKLEFLKLFKKKSPITTALNEYMVTGIINEENKNKIDSVRWGYYEIRNFIKQEKYTICIDKCYQFINTYNDVSLYYKERIGRILYQCYLALSNYTDAMNVYVDNYIISKELVANMQLEKIIHKIENMSEYNEEVKSNICTPIIMRLFYKNNNDEVIVAYLNYLDSQKCKTIKALANKYNQLNNYDIIFLNKVCTQALLMRDYVSKTEVNGVASELRAIVLKTLLKYDLKVQMQKEYLTELNTIYKSNQLQKKIDSFNHTRIFIDKENLYKYLKDDLTQEFSKFKSVQEVKILLCDSNKELLSDKFLIDKYSDIHKFYYGVIDRIKRDYLNESPYSLEDYLSTRIRHTYCNDNLKKVFEKEKLFSKKLNDNSEDYIINEYWKDRLSDEEYNMVIYELSIFSQTVDSKIQEIKEKWIRIKKDSNSDGMFDYIDFTSNFLNYHKTIKGVGDNIEEFFSEVIKVLDSHTGIILKEIRDRIDSELKSCYFNAICVLEKNIRKIQFNENYKGELLRKIEITKAQYITDIENFKDIFYMNNEKYPDFTMSDVVEFCCKIEEEMNDQFINARIETNIKNTKKYKGSIFPYLVDIVEILIRNAVQHSHIINMSDLKIEIQVNDKYELPDYEFVGNDILKEHIPILGIKVINNLSKNVNKLELCNKALEKIYNIENGNYIEQSNKEGGSGLYKIARTIYFSLNTSALFLLNDGSDNFNIEIDIDLKQFELGDIDE